MTNIDTTWLCAILIASEKISARDVTPDDLENLSVFIQRRSRLQLSALEDAFEFAWNMVAEVDDDRAINLLKKLSVMRNKVRAAILDDYEIVDYYKRLVQA